jgi:hypothetical protein
MPAAPESSNRGIATFSHHGEVEYNTPADLLNKIKEMLQHQRYAVDGRRRLEWAKSRRKKVFDELRRPTFSGPCLRLHK